MEAAGKGSRATFVVVFSLGSLVAAWQPLMPRNNLHVTPVRPACKRPTACSAHKPRPSVAISSASNGQEDAYNQSLDYMTR
jgi:hypothetical protein